MAEDITSTQDNTDVAEIVTETTQTTETETENPNAAETTEATEQNTEKTASPTELGDFVLPEGFSVEDVSMAEFKNLAKEQGLSQAQAQSVLDLYCNKVAPQMQKLQLAAFDKQVADWQAESIKIHGNKGIEAANSALKRFASPEYIQFLQDSGLGNHPQQIAMWKNVAGQISESKLVDAKPSPSQQGQLYKNSPSMYGK